MGRLSHNPGSVECPHCDGTGRIGPTQNRAEQAVRGRAAGVAPPFGRDVAQRSKESQLNCAPDLFVSTCPATGLDPWQLARQCNERSGPGSCMVLPPGESPSKYRWPEIELPVVDGPNIVVWAYDFTEDQAGKLATEILEASAYTVVDVRGCAGGPLRFKAGA